MAFCAQCGNQMTGSFCSNCGARGSAPAAAPPPAPVPAQGGSSAAKIILIVLGVFVFLGVTAVAGLVFVGYKAKQKIEQVVKEEGLGDDSKVPPARAIEDGCALLSADDASAALGVKIVRTEKHSSGGCAYYGEKKEGEKTASKGNEEAREVLEKFGKHFPDEMADADAVFSVQAGGRKQWTALRVAKRMMEAVGNKDKVFEDVPGIGDQALSIANGLVMLIVKDDYMVSVTVPCDVDQEKKREFARRVVSKL